MVRTYTLAIVAALWLALPAKALDLATEVDWFGFTGWDDAAIAGVGQTVDNVRGDVDLLVQSTRLASPFPSRVKGPNNQFISDINSGNSISPNTFTFTLSESLPIVVQYTSVDLFETLGVTLPITAGPMANTQLAGSPFVLTSVEPFQLNIQGSGVTLGTNGAARGYVEIPPVPTFTISHNSTARSAKFEAFRIGTLRSGDSARSALSSAVPEPTSWFGVLTVFVAVLRNKRSRLSE